MTDLAGSSTPQTQEQEDLALIAQAGTEVTPEFEAAFKQMSPQERNIWVENARRNVMTAEFGWAASFLEDEELGPILREASEQNWNDQKLLTRLRQTKWWKDRDENQRKWDQGSALDPATANSQVEQRNLVIKDLASQFEGVLTDEQITTLSTESLRSGWNETQLTRAVASELMKGGDAGQIRFGITGRGVRQLASQYAVPLSETAANDWSGKIASGLTTQADYENYLRNQSKSLYPSLSADIDRGINVSTIVDPYAQVAAETLGISPGTINFADPMWNAALNFDDGKGRRMMSLFEWGQHLRKDDRYGYDRTPQATSKAYRMATDLGRMFGVIA